MKFIADEVLNEFFFIDDDFCTKVKIAIKLLSFGNKL